MLSAFLKPIDSRLREEQGNKKMYYVAWVPGGITKHLGQRNLNVGWDGVFVYKHHDVWLTKKEADRFPKHLRRGGEYGHDPVRLVLLPARGEVRYWAPGVWRREQRAVHEHNKWLCKTFGLKFEVVYQTN